MTDLRIESHDESYPPSLYPPKPPVDGRDSASDGDTFTDAAITASNALNAAKLAGLGFVADPLTAWAEGEGITVSTFAFSWTGTAWQAGAVPTPESPPETPEPEAEDFGAPIPVEELPE